MSLISSNPSRPGKKEPQNTSNSQKCLLKKTRGKHTVPAVFSIRESGKAEFLLGLNNILDVLVFDGHELRLRNLALLVGRLGLQQPIGPEQRAQVLSAEGRVAMEGHDGCLQVATTTTECKRRSLSQNFKLATTKDRDIAPQMFNQILAR